MWLDDPIPIEVSRAATVPIGLQLIDETTNQPIDITGFTVSCDVALSDGEASIVAPVTAISNAPLGQFDVLFDGGAFAEVEGTQDAVILAYQVKVDDGQSAVIAMRGPLKLTPGIM